MIETTPSGFASVGFVDADWSNTIDVDDPAIAADLLKGRLVKSGLPRRFAYGLDAMRCETQIEQMRRGCVDDYLDRIMEQYPHGPNLSISGAYGTGKSRLAGAVLYDWLAAGKDGLWLNLPSFLIQVKRAIGNRERQEDMGALAERAETAPLLVLDDIGMGGLGGQRDASDYDRAMFYDVVNTRYENERPMIITTNETRQKMDHYFTSRIISRLIDGAWTINFGNAPSLRAPAPGKETTNA